MHVWVYTFISSNLLELTDIDVTRKFWKILPLCCTQSVRKYALLMNAHFELTGVTSAQTSRKGHNSVLIENVAFKLRWQFHHPIGIL